MCNAKRDGERRARLTHLPPLLCFHLLRFTYDRKRGCKRKSKLRVQIPARLDMEPFVEGNGPEGRWRYVLKGILIHLGPQPFSGHYVAVVRDYRLGWIVCNDEQTQRVKSLNLARLESEALRTRPGGSPARSAGSASGGLDASGERERVHESRNAYMVLYEQQDRFETRASPDTKYKVEMPPALKGEEKSLLCGLDLFFAHLIFRFGAEQNEWKRRIGACEMDGTRRRGTALRRRNGTPCGIFGWASWCGSCTRGTRRSCSTGLAWHLQVGYSVITGG